MGSAEKRSDEEQKNRPEKDDLMIHLGRDFQITVGRVLFSYPDFAH
jgi:hypothetical protein